MRTRLIIEGIDGSGKSTLAKKLAGKFELKLGHATAYTDNDFKWHKKEISKNNVIWDRFHLGEMIWPFIFGRNSKMNDEEFKKLIKYMEKKKVILIVTQPDLKVAKKRVMTRDKNDTFNTVKMRMANERFKLLFSLYKGPKLIVGTNPLDSFDEIVKFIEGV